MSTVPYEDITSGIDHLSPYHAKYYAYELTKRCSSSTLEKLTASLSDAQVDLNPHQVEAALFAFKSPLSKGAILADEVGLGKTIEAGLVIAQKWAELKRKILIIVPANLRTQWTQELVDKFFLPSTILETKSFNQEIKNGNLNPFNQKDIVICTYQFARSKDIYIKQIQWDLVVIDEAHRLRNVYKTSNKIANALKQAVAHAPKILLTATPLQNSLLELYGLVSLIDDFTFGDLKSFKSQFSKLTTEDSFEDLKERLKPICKRTLRRQVLEYINYTNRIPITQEFVPSEEEERLYNLVSDYLQSPMLYALPPSQRKLMTLILRKLLASSTHAITGTLEALANKLESTLKTHSQKETSDVAEGLSQDFETYDELKDEWQEDDEKSDDAEESEEKVLTPEDLSNISSELKSLREFECLARSIQKNSKGEVLLTALEKGFSEARQHNAPQKAIIFTESTRTQKYLKEVLEDSDYKGQVVLFNGTNTDADCQAIYKQWLEKYKGTDRVSGSKTADIRAALVDHFKNNATIMIATEAAAEGINLQFCSLVVNYDLPWNPQRIEQRIGRCHRYGQKYDVVVVNFLNKKNAADQRVYELLDQKFRLFSGVFGASDEVLGSIETGVDFEKRIADIYQQCRTAAEIKEGFDTLQKDLESQIDEKMSNTRQKLLENFDEEVHEKLRLNHEQSKTYLGKYEQWLWNITRFYLRDYANFDLGDNAFRLIKNPFEGETIHPGPYRIGKHVEDANLYRIGHPLAQRIIQRCKQTDLKPVELVFDYSNTPKKITILEELVGQSGWLTAVNLTIQSFEAEDTVVLSGMTDEGKVLSQEQCQRLFSLPAQECALSTELSGSLDAALKGHYQSLEASLVQENMHRNADFFDDEMDKLEKWSEDLKSSLELELKELDKNIKAQKTEAKKIQNLDAKVTAQRHIKELEKKRNKMRLELYQAQDDVDSQKETLISRIEDRLKQRLEKTPLFQIKWKVI